MRRLTILLLVLIGGSVGCESREEARRREAIENLKAIQRALDSYQEQQPHMEEEPEKFKQ